MERATQAFRGRGRPGAGRRRATAGAACVAMAGLGACGLLNPVPTSRVLMDAPAGQALPVADGAARRADPCESAVRVGDTDLRAARCEAMLQINEHLVAAADAANTNVDFNALSWPAGAAALYWKLRAPDRHSLTGGALAAAGLYGLVDSRIPKQAVLHLDAVKTMACAYAESSAYVYEARELYAPAYAGGPGDDPVAPGLVTSMQNLLGALTTFRQASLALELTPRAGRTAARRDSMESALGPGLAGKAAAKPADLQPLWDEIAGWDAEAAGVLSDIAAMRRRVRTQAMVLRARISAAEITLRHELVGQAPAPRNPVEVFKELTAQLQAGQAALAAAAPASTASGAAQGAAVVDAAAATRIATAVAALDPPSRIAWRRYLTEQVAPLMRAVAEARAWTGNERAVQREVADAQRAAFECPAAAVPSPAPPPAPPATASGNGARPASSVTPEPGTPLPAPPAAAPAGG